ncbi:MAG: hypothetical protein J6J74_02210 [Elusimicrobiaceae bacterium]|nr:hypothetical protein [Elusimicrobiaceae bacterium]
MIYAAIIAGLAALAAFGAVMYRSGRTAAENAVLKEQERENEKVEQIIDNVADLPADNVRSRLQNISRKE